MARTLSAQARALAATDPAMGALIERLGPRSIDDRRRDHDAFAELFRIVVGQQVSTGAARSIWARLCALHDGAPPGWERTIAGGEQPLRECGLSGRKASYVLGIAEAFATGGLDEGRLRAADDEEVVAELTAQRGLGRWSAEMFLMFYLARPDVFSGGDLGLRKGVAMVGGLEQVPSAEEAEAHAERWRPQRTLAAIYLWEALAVELPG